MIPIYFCDDHRPILLELTEIVTRSLQIHELDFHIRLATEQPEELLKAIDREQGIYFLDVDLGPHTMNGFELGKHIRALDPRGFIIYITTHEELLAETFKYRLEAMDYIFKDQPDKMIPQISACLTQISVLLKNDQRDERPHFKVVQGNRTTFVPLDDIIYFETTERKHVIRLIHLDGHQEFYGNLTDISKTLAKNFLRVHRSFLVNRTHISGYDRKSNTLSLSQQHHCFIARNKLKLVEKSMPHHS